MTNHYETLLTISNHYQPQMGYQIPFWLPQMVLSEVILIRVSNPLGPKSSKSPNAELRLQQLHESGAWDALQVGGVGVKHGIGQMCEVNETKTVGDFS